MSPYSKQLEAVLSFNSSIAFLSVILKLFGVVSIENAIYLHLAELLRSFSEAGWLFVDAFHCRMSLFPLSSSKRGLRIFSVSLTAPDGTSVSRFCEKPSSPTDHRGGVPIESSPRAQKSALTPTVAAASSMRSGQGRDCNPRYRFYCSTILSCPQAFFRYACFFARNLVCNQLQLSLKYSSNLDEKGITRI